MEPGGRVHGGYVSFLAAAHASCFHLHLQADFLELINGGDIKPFRVDVWPQGHQPTDFERWQSAKSLYAVAWAEGAQSKQEAHTRFFRSL